MTSFRPNLTVNRLVVKRERHIAYDAHFHAGLNVIAGENSSGKSTVLDFLFYGLGGDLSDWREAALLCTEVVLEVEINGLKATLAREISDKSGQPMRISLASFDDSNANSDWSIHAYRRSDKKESFSQVLFRLLGMPEVTGDANSSITMNQMLRLLYADQLSPVDRIFLFQPFDTALTRQTVGDLLCGAYDNSLYRSQLRLREAEKSLSAVTADWRNAISVFSGTEHDISSEWIEAERREVQTELAAVRKHAAALEERIFNAEVSDGLTLDEQKSVYEQLSETQALKLDLESRIDAIQLEMKDSEEFINALQSKLDQLQNAGITAKYLDGISFIYCPSCYAPIEEVGDHACTLCKAPFDKDRARSRILAIINETGLQINQSRLLQEERQKDLQKLDAELQVVDRKWASLNARYALLNRLPSTEFRADARKLYGRAGYLERQLENLSEKASVIERIEALSDAKKRLNAEILDLKHTIEAGERVQRNQLSRAYSAISDNTVALLRRDLDRQDLFQNAQSVTFSFGDDRLAVNGESFFSASSMVFLRNSFFAAFFKSSLEDPKFRHPRILLMDTIEDKGMEPERSHRFQSLLREISENSRVDHQIIYATAMLEPSLQESDFIVDRFYTHENRTLNILP
ncbi:ATP-binding protein [Qipengyuania pacifica]|uniref:ATP-binding protein n=1 Tax=Qipengyuania pacifica TaxID=2860199 RepID=UPI001C9D6856|nr:ATP-binding protein [Qipengyuania pacifica]MBY8334716.1 AAA family ATPase [Qipengyuania pacifica]